MSRVDFYILGDAGEAARQVFACKLAEKAYRLKHSVHIRTTDPGLASRMDELLWTFRDGSFVPHEVTSAGKTPESPVTIGAGDDGGNSGLLINLADDVPANIAAFARIAEIVSSDDDSKQRSRKRFTEYRDQGHTLETHNL